jgi:hypothetical protein
MVATQQQTVERNFQYSSARFVASYFYLEIGGKESIVHNQKNIFSLVNNLSNCCNIH